jgi:hypothetical protein
MDLHAPRRLLREARCDRAPGIRDRPLFAQGAARLPSSQRRAKRPAPAAPSDAGSSGEVGQTSVTSANWRRPGAALACKSPRRTPRTPAPWSFSVHVHAAPTTRAHTQDASDSCRPVSPRLPTRARARVGQQGVSDGVVCERVASRAARPERTRFVTAGVDSPLFITRAQAASSSSARQGVSARVARRGWPPSGSDQAERSASWYACARVGNHPIGHARESALKSLAGGSPPLPSGRSSFSLRARARVGSRRRRRGKPLGYATHCRAGWGPGRPRVTTSSAMKQNFGSCTRYAPWNRSTSRVAPLITSTARKR